MSDVQIRIRIDDQEDLAAAQALADKYPGVKTEETFDPPAPGVVRLVDPITAVLIGAGAVLVAKFLTDWWEQRRGGLVIDQRKDRDEIYRDPELPLGYVVVFPADGGSVKLETKDMPKDAMQQLLESVISGAFKSVTDIAKAASEILGKDKVETAPA